MERRKLMQLYHSRKNVCSVCGCTLEDNTGNGLGSIFVLDKDGHFYCMDHDQQLKDGDERIFEAEFPEDDKDI